MLNEKAQINDLLAADHSELDELLAEFFAAFEIGSLKRIYKSLDLFWARLAMHIRAEHLHLFPLILDAFGSQEQTTESNLPSAETAKKLIGQLQNDHNFFMCEILAAIKKMRDLRESGKSDAAKQLKQVCETVTAVKDRLATHNRLEEAEVYRWANLLFLEPERFRLNEKMRNEIQNLPPRFGQSE